MTTHKERVEKIRNFVGKNRLFTVFAVIITLLLLSNFFFSTENKMPDSSTSQSEVVEETQPANQTEAEAPHWQFYWIDLLILAGGGGFCSVMIIRQRKKAREELQ